MIEAQRYVLLKIRRNYLIFISKGQSISLFLNKTTSIHRKMGNSIENYQTTKTKQYANIKVQKEGKMRPYLLEDIDACLGGHGRQFGKEHISFANASSTHLANMFQFPHNSQSTASDIASPNLYTANSRASLFPTFIVFVYTVNHPSIF